ncbi:ATP-binding protein [Brevundimonas goettingensis]|uniref:Sensory/regulatory protein RpfC n=1 Tax=Brevundimonas goettingensis TaxID=2774190 RepID=A0A975GXE0_9CAUL|nr:ATP-binding protein [Brevundimonas goettingensis]QTC92828.1 response regulator [Brevundimonas goettingensis]
MTATPTADVPEARSPVLHGIVASGNMRYWIIASWALALATTIPWIVALAWFAGTTVLGLARTVVETRMTTLEPTFHARLKLVVATASCVAWAIAPLLSYFSGHDHSLAMAVALLMAGYMLVFTQMRSAPREALIVSLPYTVVVLILIADLWGTRNSLTVLAMAPVLGLALFIKVVITRMKDDELAAVNARQAGLIVDLEAARDRADAASDAKSNFLAIISHELRTPMNGVLGAAQLLETTDLRPAQANYVSIIRQSGESLLVQLNDILDLTKIEAGRLEIDPVATETSDLLERLIGPFRAQAEAKGLDFSVERTGEHPALVRIDPLRLAQITHNLLGNAVKFTDSGEIRVATHKERLCGDRMRYRFSVTDSGAGIGAEDIHRLFQPFSQVDASSTRRFGGSGLGLSICRRLAHLMGGEVSVVSAPGVGSTFTLELEMDVLDWTVPTAIDDGAPAGAADVAALHVLIVEDHPVNRMVLEAWMGSVGHTCATAENGQIALDMADQSPFDLIVMDVNMPVMDGLTATRELRSRPGPNQQTPIAVLSASARPEDHALGHAAGADAYVDKPVDFGALARVLAVAPLGREAVQSLAVRQAAA